MHRPSIKKSLAIISTLKTILNHVFWLDAGSSQNSLRNRGFIGNSNVPMLLLDFMDIFDVTDLLIKIIIYNFTLRNLFNSSLDSELLQSCCGLDLKILGFNGNLSKNLQTLDY